MFSLTLSRSLYRFALVLSLALMLQACSGGDDDPPAPPANADPKGYYNNTGTATVLAGTGNTQVSITDLQGMIYNNRLIMFSLAQGLSYDGTISINGNSYSGTVNAYDDGTLVATSAAVSGTIVQGSTVTGTLTGTGAGSGSFTLNYAANNGEAAALSVVQRSGGWSAPVGGSTTDFRIFVQANGDAIDDAMTADGLFRYCSMTGPITPISNTHLYTVSVDLSCSPNDAANGTYTGLATTRTQNSGTPNDRLLFVVTNGTYSFSNEFYP